MHRAEAYWRKALAGFTTPTRLSLERAAANVSLESGYAEEQGRLSAEQSEQVQRFAREQQRTVNTVVPGGWGRVQGPCGGVATVVKKRCCLERLCQVGRRNSQAWSRWLDCSSTACR